MIRFFIVLAIAILAMLAPMAQGQTVLHTHLYDIAEGTELKDLTGKYGEFSMQIPFDDGWVAHVYQFNEHNVIVETAPDDKQYIAAVQIQGMSNPPGQGLLGINLGDSIDAAIKILGQPIEKRASIDEKTNESIPGALIFQYINSSLEVTNGQITSIKIHFGPRKKLQNTSSDVTMEE